MTLLYSAAILLPVWSAAAQTPGQCAIAPTCSELGYEQQTSDCSGQHMLKCPFDKDQVFCGGEACNYTNTTKPVGCNIAYSCVKNEKTYYSGTCESCYAGYSRQSNGTCSKTCTYTNTSTDHCSRYDSCQLGSATGNKTYYKCTQCTGNFTLTSSGTCTCNISCGSGYERDYSNCSCAKIDCYNSCYYEQGIIDDSDIAAMTTAKPTNCGDWSGILGCFRNGTLVYKCNGLNCF